MQTSERGREPQRRLRLTRPCHDSLGIEVSHGIELGLAPVDPVEHSLHQLDRRDLLVPDQRGQFVGGTGGERHGSVLRGTHQPFTSYAGIELNRCGGIGPV